MSFFDEIGRRRAAAYRKGYADGKASLREVLEAADAVVSAYDARGDMPGAITTLEAVLRKHGYAMPAGKMGDA